MKLPSLHAFKKAAMLFVLGGTFAALQGCGMIYKTTGDVLVNYGEDNMLPYVMTGSDVEMACAMGKSMTPLLMSFESVGSDPDKLGVMVFTTAAICSNQKALEAQLHYIRALNAGRASEAQDARIQQKRWAEVSANRQMIAWNRMVKAYGQPGDGQCPDLDDKFDQLVWMVGLISGLQALVNDTTAGGAVGVPRNIPALAADASTCLNSQEWWGVPKAIQAVVWTMLPMLAPKDKSINTWATLKHSQQIGFQEGVRLSSALYAMAAFSKGDTDRLKQIIRDFAANNKHVNANYRMMDAMSKMLITGLSDILWTKHTGKRTPFGELGTFWDDKPAGLDINIQDLLN